MRLQTEREELRHEVSFVSSNMDNGGPSRGLLRDFATSPINRVTVSCPQGPWQDLAAGGGGQQPVQGGGALQPGHRRVLLQAAHQATGIHTRMSRFQIQKVFLRYGL